MTDELHPPRERPPDADLAAGRPAEHVDVAIIGGGVAGLSAALVLGRSRRRTVVIDAGEPRNAPSPGVHGFSQLAVRERRVVRIAGEGKGVSGVVFEDGEVLPRAGVLVRPPFRLRSNLPAALGCALTEQGIIRTDEDGRTSVSGVFAMGDCASLMQQVAVAVGQAARAAIVLNNELLLEART